jgi:hypothetical protein
MEEMPIEHSRWASSIVALDNATDPIAVEAKQLGDGSNRHIPTEQPKRMPAPCFLGVRTGAIPFLKFGGTQVIRQLLMSCHSILSYQI